MFRKALLAALALATVSVATLASSTDAEARWRRGYVGPAAAALVIGGTLGAIAAANAAPRHVVVDEDYVAPTRVCRLRDVYNRFGDYVGTRRVCRTVY